MPDFLFTIILVAAVAAGLAAAVDAVRRHPVRWEQAGRSMRLRLFIILSPLFSFLLLPVGIGLTAYYFARVRPGLIAADRRAGHRDPPPGGSLGIGMTWHELGPWQKFKAVVAFLGAITLEVLIFAGGEGPDVPLIGSILFAPVLLILLFLGIYLGLSVFVVMIPLLLGRPAGKLVNDKPSLLRAKRRSDREWEREKRRW